MRSERVSPQVFWTVQVLVLAALAVAYANIPEVARDRLRTVVSPTGAFQPLPVPRPKALVLQPLYDDPHVVSFEQLAAVLRKIRPTFERKKLKSNHVEHALRMWGVDATFRDPHALSGREMLEYLTDQRRVRESWGDGVEPMLTDGPVGVVVNWGSERGRSYHHDHLLACVTEAGVSLEQPVVTASGAVRTFADVLEQALYDFRYDERETEWSTLAFALWLPPTRQWKAPDGRRLSFDLLAERLLRGDLLRGVCAGTHRVYSLLVLLRLDDQWDLLSDRVRQRVERRLARVRDLLVASQREDGRWPFNWPDGADADKSEQKYETYEDVIATGHHLEWLALAPPELQPPRERIVRAAQWVVQQAARVTPSDLKRQYTFYTHVGNALALWRHTTPFRFWRDWREAHPEVTRPFEAARKPTHKDADDSRTKGAD